jgi:hypothetical protein
LSINYFFETLLVPSGPKRPAVLKMLRPHIHMHDRRVPKGVFVDNNHLRRLDGKWIQLGTTFYLIGGETFAQGRQGPVSLDLIPTFTPSTGKVGSVAHNR